jgi:hypothetical protein
MNAGTLYDKEWMEELDTLKTEMSVHIMDKIFFLFGKIWAQHKTDFLRMNRNKFFYIFFENDREILRKAFFFNPSSAVLRCAKNAIAIL